jgi:hypothetical protein
VGFEKVLDAEQERHVRAAGLVQIGFPLGGILLL